MIDSVHASTAEYLVKKIGNRPRKARDARLSRLKKKERKVVGTLSNRHYVRLTSSLSSIPNGRFEMVPGVQTALATR